MLVSTNAGWRAASNRCVTGGLGSMGFGLPSALGVAAAYDGRNGRPKRVVVDIDGDGSFLMNVQVGRLQLFDLGQAGRARCFTTTFSPAVTSS
jgi:thiamine pyrophosphate-dependent acetolactate synthase large subunit-like protein